MPLKNQMQIAATILLLYTAPLWITLIFYFSHLNIPKPLDFANEYIKWLGTFSVKSESELNLFHKIMMPIIAGIAAFSFDNKSISEAQSRGEIYRDYRTHFIIYCIISIAAVIILSVGFTTHGSIDFSAPAQIDKDRLATYTGISSYLSSTSANIATYLMVLLGLKAQK